MMTDWLADLELAIRHIAEGELRVARQRDLVAWLEHGRHPTDQAEKLLSLLENILREMIAHKAFKETICDYEEWCRERDRAPSHRGTDSGADGVAKYSDWQLNHR
ncbi:MAG: hypothetical protein WBX25_37705 [Rhodomicrobium sp.]